MFTGVPHPGGRLHLAWNGDGSGDDSEVHRGQTCELRTTLVRSGSKEVQGRSEASTPESSRKFSSISAGQRVWNPRGSRSGAGTTSSARIGDRSQGRGPTRYGDGELDAASSGPTRSFPSSRGVPEDAERRFSSSPLGRVSLKWILPSPPMARIPVSLPLLRSERVRDRRES
jgi:hypothetical protein